MVITPEIKAILDTWRLPVGLYESDENARIMRAEINKLTVVSHAALYKIAFDLDKRLTWAPGYAPSEQRAVVTAWFQQHRDVLPNESNFNALAVRIRDFYGNHFTLENLDKAAPAVKLEGKSAAQLQQELEQRQADFERKEYERIQREKAENLKPFDQGAAVKKAEQEKAAQANAKMQEQAQRELDAFRQNFTVNGRVPNTIDHQLSQEYAKAFNIRINTGGKYNAVFTLAVVRRAASMLSDRPNAAEVIRACEKAKNQLIDAQNNRPDQGPIR